MPRSWTVAAGVVLLLRAAPPAWAHVFPDHSDPRVGHTLDASPPSVRIWFDGDLEPVFSTIRVENADRQRVDRGDAQVDPHDAKLLEVSLSPLPSGSYQVFWSAVARDGHRTEGSFPFVVK
jgi:methionine-rich copper-binding protein CopC